MPRPRKKDSERKEKLIGIHCTTHQYEAIERRSGEYSLSEFCLKASLGKEIIPKDTTLPKLLLELSKSGTNVNQIAHQLNSGRKESLSDTDRKLLEKISSTIEQIKNQILK